MDRDTEILINKRVRIIMKADAKTETEVINVTKQCFNAFVKRDLNGFLSFFSPDPDVVLIGTGRNEKCKGPAKIRAIIGRSFFTV